MIHVKEENIMTPDKKYVVTKSNELIEASYKLTAGEQKIILMLASLIQPSDEEFKLYKIKVKDLMKILDIKNKGSYQQVKKVTDELQSKTLKIKNENSDLTINWIASSEYFDKEGYVEVEFSRKMKPFLLKLKSHFTSYQLQNIIQLRSSYSIRIYELLKQYESIKTRIFGVQELREMLGLEEGTYSLYKDFKRRVILQAQKELQEKTDIIFDFKEIKKGKKIENLKFLIHSKEIQKKCTNENIYIVEEKKNNLVNEVVCLIPKITNTSAKKLLNIVNYDISLIQSKLDVYRYFEEKETVYNIPKFFQDAIKEDWKIPKKNKTLCKSYLKNFDEEEIDFDQIMAIHNKLTAKDIFKEVE